MAFLDEELPKKRASAAPGEILADLSIEELKARIALYRDEIQRLEREIAAKEKHRQAADAFFRR